MKTKYYVARVKRFDPTCQSIIKKDIGTYVEAHSLVKMIQDSVALEVGGMDKSEWSYTLGVMAQEAR